MRLRDTDFNFIGLPVNRRLLISVPFLSTGGALAVFILTGISLRVGMIVAAVVSLTGITYWPFDVFSRFGRLLVGEAAPAGVIVLPDSPLLGNVSGPRLEARGDLFRIEAGSEEAFLHRKDDSGKSLKGVE